jgi:aspartate oxidase
MAINLVSKNNIISGVTFLDELTQKVVVCEGKSVILASGGFASLYKNYTSKLEGTNFLLSEAARADGGRLVDEKGKFFVDELNTRGFVTRAIFKEMQKDIYKEELDKPTSIKNILELQNALLVSKAIAKSALERQESRGSHFRIDYPETDKKFEKNTLIGIEDL